MVILVAIITGIHGAAAGVFQTIEAVPSKHSTTGEFLDSLLVADIPGAAFPQSA